MSIMHKTYEIIHSWGDPRETLFHDGLPIAHATYQEGDIYLLFRIVPKKQGEIERFAWVVEPPATIREVTGGSRSKCMEICNRVVEYVHSIDTSANWQMRGISITEVLLDTSKISGWFVTKVKIFKKRYARLLMCLPTLYSALMLLSGYIIGYLSYAHYINLSHNATAKTILPVVGCLALIRLSTEIYGDYRLTEMTMIFRLFSDRTFRYKLASLKITLRAYGIRYAITSVLAIMLIFFGL